MNPQITPLSYTYKKSDADVWVLNSDDIPVEKSKIKDQQIVHLGPSTVAGNHKHPRTEWFIGIGDLEFIWLDDTGKKHIQHMHPEGKILLIEVPPYLPHAVRNNSNTTIGVLFEYGSEKMKDVEKLTVI